MIDHPQLPPHHPPGPDVAEYPVAPTELPDTVLDGGSYLVRFARTTDDLDRILRLRYQVFNLELGEGLDTSHHSGRDEDELDSRFHHLVIVARRAQEVVGTYRMQTADMARRLGGFYSEQEFDLSGLDSSIVDGAVEIGRACVARAHRNGRVLHLLWRGLAAYLTWNRKRYLFGCCSVNSQDPAVGISVHRHLERIGAVDRTLGVHPRPGLHCELEHTDAPLPAAHIPALFQTYLTLGARVAGPPAIDRQFKTIDWLVLLDVSAIDPATYRTFFR